MKAEDIGLGGGAAFFVTSVLDHPDFTPEHLAKMPIAGMGGSTIPLAITERLASYGIKVYRSYGSTEHPSITGCSVHDPEPKRLATDGVVLPGVEMRLDEDGEISSRGPDLFLGYTDPELTATVFDDEGWYRTGDVGVVDDDGYLTITDRVSDIIIRGGENISAQEVEEQLIRLPSVAEVAVVVRTGRPPRRARRRHRAAAPGRGRADPRGRAGPPRRGRPGQAEVAGVDPRGGRPPAHAVGQGAEVQAPAAAPRGLAGARRAERLKVEEDTDGRG